MPNSKSHSSWYYLLNKLLADYSGIGQDNHVNDLSQAKTYRIVGKNIRNLDLSKDIVTIGDGKSYVDLKKQKIEAGSRVIIDTHGGFSSGKSILDLEETGGFTSYAFQNLAAAAGGAALNVEVFTCHGGYAINNIVDLPKGSSLMTFIDDQDLILSSNCYFLEKASLKFRDPENQFMRFASYLLTSPHITKFAIRGHNGNHFFFCDPDSRESYGIDDIKLWQKDLLKEYADFLSSIKEDLEPLNKAQIDKVIELVENEAELNQFIENFDTKKYIGDYLIGKAGNNRVEEVKNILNKGADVNAVDDWGWSALHMVVQEGRLEVVRELLQNKDINVNAVGINGRVALHIAVQEGRLEVVRELLQNKDINVNAVGISGRLALQTAANEGHLEIVRELLQHKDINVNAVDDWGWSALHMAAQKGHLEVVLELLQCKHINVNAVEESSYSALQIAANGGHLEIVRALLHRGADVNAVNKLGKSALYEAAENGHLEMVKLLLAKGGVMALERLETINLEISDEIKAEVEKFKRNPILYISQNNATSEEKIQAIQNYYSASTDMAKKLEKLVEKFTSLLAKNKEMQPNLEEAQKLKKEYEQATTGEEKQRIIANYTKLSDILTKHGAQKLNEVRRKSQASIVRSL